MKQGLNPRRSRGRGNPRGRHPNNGGNRNYQLDSNGPEGRIRGSAAQILERYLALARDAQSSGDTVAAENLFQHAEHYFRVINMNGGNSGQQGRQRPMGAEDDGREVEGPGDFTDGQGRSSNAPSENWRQPRARDDQHQGRSEERPRHRGPEQRRSGEGEEPHAQPQMGQASSPADEAPEAGAVAGERGGRRPVRSAGEDVSEHRPAFLRRREAPPPVGEAEQGSERQPAAEESGAPAMRASGAPETETAEAAETVGEEKPKARTRRRRTTAEGEAAPRAPRRRSTAKRQAEGDEEGSATAEEKDLETSA